MDVSLLHVVLFSGIFAGAFVSGFAGFAFSAIAGVFLLHVLPACEAVPLMMICSLCVQATSLLLLRSSMQWKASLPYVLGGACGVPPALWLLSHADTAALRVGFGVFLATYAGFMFFRPGVSILHAVATRRFDAAIGFAGGLVGGVTAMPGALPTIWCELRGLAKDQQRGLVQPFIAAMQLVALMLLVCVNGFPGSLFAHAGFAIPALLGGTVLGVLMFGRVDQTTFRRVTLLLLFLGGVALIA